MSQSLIHRVKSFFQIPKHATITINNRFFDEVSVHVVCIIETHDILDKVAYLAGYLILLNSYLFIQ